MNPFSVNRVAKGKITVARKENNEHDKYIGINPDTVACVDAHELRRAIYTNGNVSSVNGCMGT